MSAPRTLELHPTDLLGGLLIPEPQLYLLAVPATDLSPARVHARLAPLITDAFGRLAYRFRRRLATWDRMELAAEPTAPLVCHRGPVDLAALDPDVPLSDRHWALHVGLHGEVSLLALRFDHLLGHGELARQFLAACGRALRGVDGDAALRLDDGQQSTFDELQQALLTQLQARNRWAEYRRLELEGAPLRRLTRALGLGFTEGVTLWLAYHLQAANRAVGRVRPLDVLGFRMDPSFDLTPPVDPTVGNEGLLLERWQVDEAGAWERLDQGAAASRRALARFADLYRALPGKPLVDAGLRGLLARSRRPDAARDKLVVNNLGPSPLPFFRPLFFDPQNDTDQLGLVYVDGSEDRVCLQLGPPRQYLAHHPWEPLERQLRESLEDPEGWVNGE